MRARHWAIVAATLLAATALVTWARPAQAARPACVSVSEFRHLHQGQTITRVRRIVGGHGRVDGAYSSGTYRSVTLQYRTCGTSGLALLDLSTDDTRTSPLRLTGKWMIR